MSRNRKGVGPKEKRAGQTAKSRGTVYTDGKTIKADATGRLTAIATDPPATPGGSGTVTSVALTMPTAVFDVAGSPVTTMGSLDVTLDVQNANKVFAGPTTGADAQPTFRALVAADIPAPADLTASVLALATSTEFTNERVLVAGVDLTLTDAGAGSTATMDHDDTAVTPGTYLSANVTINQRGHITVASSNSLHDYTTLLITNNALPVPSSITNGAELYYASEIDTLYLIANNGATGKLYYINRVIDAAVLLATYTSKRTQFAIYSPVSGLLYICYTNSWMSVNPTTGAVVTAAVTTVQADAGAAIRTSTGIIYSVSGDKKIYRTDPATDLIVGAGVTLTTFPLTNNAIAYSPSNDCMYIGLSNGSIDRYDCSTNTVAANFSVFSGGGGAGSVIYASDTGLLYITNLNGASIKTIDPASDTVANTYAFPAGCSATGGQKEFNFGDYVYIGTQITGDPYAAILIFRKTSSPAFVGALRSRAGSNFRLAISGVPSERVIYAMENNDQNGTGGGASNLYPFRMP